MTVVSTKSISGVTSITSPQADDAITLHTNDTTQRVSVTTGGMNVTGVITATSFDAPVTGDFSIADKIVHTGDTNTAIRFPSTDTFTVETAGSERLRITSGGAVGINTTVPSTAQDLTFDGASNYKAGILYKQAGVNQYRFQCEGGTGHVYYDTFVDGGDHIFRTDAASTGGSEKLRITEEGKVRVGSGDPTYEFELIGAGSKTLLIGSTDAGGSTLVLDGDSNGDGSGSDYVTITHSTAGNLEYHNRKTAAHIFKIGTSNEEKLRITSAGRVGINATSPNTELEIQSATDPKIRLQSQESGSKRLDLWVDGGTAISYIAADQSASQLAFKTAGSERLRITSTGKVGINTTNPGTNLTVWANDGVTDADVFQVRSKTGAFNIQVSDSDASNPEWAIRTYSSEAIVFKQATTERVRIDSSGRLLANHNASVGSGKIQAFASQDAVDILSYSTTDTHGGRLTFYRSKNATIGSNTEVASGDSLGRIDWRGYNDDGTTYNQGARIEALVDGAVNSSTDMPTSLVFKTSPDGSSTPSERVRITSAGTVAIGGDYTQTANSLYVQGNPGIKVQGGTGSGGNANLLELKHPNTVSSGGAGDGPAMLFNGEYQSNPWAFAKICSVNSGSGYGADFQIHVHPANGTQGASLVKALSIVGDGASGADVMLPDGNIKFASGHGVSFINAPDIATGETVSSSVLDDYEEGTFTPKIVCSSGTGQGGTSNGYYTKVGRLVTCHGTLQWTSLSGTTASYAQIQGLPYTTLNATGYRSGSVLGGQVIGVYWSGTDHAYINFGCDANMAAFYITAVAMNDHNGSNYTHTPNIASTGTLYGFTLTYYTA